MTLTRWLALGALCAGPFLFSACTPRAIRGGAGTGNLSIDEPAMSTTLDKADIDYLVAENLDGLYGSKFWQNEIEVAQRPYVMAIWPIENSTSEHLDDQLLTILSSIETSLINSGKVHVVARSRQAQLAREIGIQQGEIYQQGRAVELGRQLGAKYFVTGKVTSVDERLQNARRVQYRLFIQIIEIETGIVKFQHEASRSKALKR